MDFLSAIIFGFLQGIFEWLPISSQGNILGLLSFFGTNPQDALKITIFLHIGTLLSAIVYFRKEIIEILKWKNENEKKLGKFIIISSIATLITAIPSYLILEKLLGFGISFILILLALLLIITGLLQLKNKKTKNKKQNNEKKLNIKNSIFVGLGQGFSILPGISRSGITTSFLLFEGFDPEKAFQISFLMSIPAILIAEIGYGFFKGFIFNEWGLIALIFSFIVGLISMNLLIKFARRINFAYFCFVLAVIYLIGFFVI